MSDIEKSKLLYMLSLRHEEDQKRHEEERKRMDELLASDRESVRLLNQSLLVFDLFLKLFNEIIKGRKDYEFFLA